MRSRMRSVMLERGRVLAPTVAAALLVVAGGASSVAASPPAPITVDEIVAKVDAVIFHCDRQDGLAGYTADVRELSGATMQGGTQSTPSTRSSGRLVVDVEARTQVVTPEKGKARPLGAFAPSCGPWTLTSVMQVEVGLFSTPLAEQFTEGEFERFVAKRGDGHALRFKPRTPIGSASPLRPAVTSVSIYVDGEGVPTDGTLSLDMQITQETAQIEFEFEQVEGSHRIKSIANTISMANLTVRPKLSFTFTEVEGLVLPAAVLVEVAAKDLSPSMAQMMSGMSTTLELSAHQVTHTVPPVPASWADVSAFYLRRQIGTAFPDDDVAAVLPAPTSTPKDRKAGQVRHRLYLPHGLRLTFDRDDVLVEARLRLRPGSGFKPFVGALTDDITAESTRADVEAALGEPAAMDSATKTTTASYPALGLDVVYQGKVAGASAGIVTLVLRVPATD